MNENGSYFSALNESIQRLEKIKNAFVSPQFN